jgi:hypothetical protein
MRQQKGVSRRQKFAADKRRPLNQRESGPAKRKRAAKPRVKNDPKYVAAARELRDRYLEQVNGPDGERLLAAASAPAKYDVGRRPELAAGAATVEVAESEPLRLPAA